MEGDLRGGKEVEQILVLIFAYDAYSSYTSIDSYMPHRDVYYRNRKWGKSSSQCELDVDFPFGRFAADVDQSIAIPIQRPLQALLADMHLSLEFTSINP